MWVFRSFSRQLYLASWIGLMGIALAGLVGCGGQLGGTDVAADQGLQGHSGGAGGYPGAPTIGSAAGAPGGGQGASTGSARGAPTSPANPASGNPAPAEGTPATDVAAEEQDREPPDASGRHWMQWSTDDSTSMASAQLYKVGGGWGNGLHAHEFINYYDPSKRLFDNEPWAMQGENSEGFVYGLSVREVDEEQDQAEIQDQDETREEEGEALEDPSQIEALFQIRAPGVSRQDRRNWALFYCVDVSGSMEGEKMEFVRKALIASLDHLKAGDRVTLVTFDDDAEDIFVDLEYEGDKDTMIRAFRDLRAGASTNMIAGLKQVYHWAQDKFEPGLLHRVVLFGDGRANVGDVDLEAFKGLTRIHGQEGIYLTSVGVGYDYDWTRMDQLSDAGKGAHVFLPNSQEVDLIFGDYFTKLVEVAADSIAIEVEVPAGVELDLAAFSGEEVSFNREERLQNVVLAAGDDLTLLARFDVLRPEAMQEPFTLRFTYRPLKEGKGKNFEVNVASLDALLASPGALFERTRIVKRFADYAISGKSHEDTRKGLLEAIDVLGESDWGLEDIRGQLSFETQ